MISKILGFGLFAVAISVPSFVFAQTAPTTGLLNVYVQVLNSNTGTTYSPSNFTVSISGQNPSITSFQGSQSGTLVTLQPGAYSATVANVQYGFSPSYSVGCSGTIAAGQTQTCVVTLTPSYTYPNHPTTPYYPYLPQPLTCRTDTPTVALGQAARFTAVGGVGGTYNWFTSAQNFPNVGPVLTAAFQSSGTHTVRVTNAAQTATCVVTVTTTYYPQPISPTYPTYPTHPTYPQPTYPTYPTYPSYPSYTYPRFPNTGFAPTNGAEMAFAAVLLMGVAIAAYPYARKAFTLAVR